MCTVFKALLLHDDSPTTSESPNWFNDLVNQILSECEKVDTSDQERSIVTLVTLCCLVLVHMVDVINQFSR
jgi:hypothetical protein